MKKIITVILALFVLASCSKEAPIVKEENNDPYSNYDRTFYNKIKGNYKYIDSTYTTLVGGRFEKDNNPKFDYLRIENDKLYKSYNFYSGLEHFESPIIVHDTYIEYLNKDNLAFSGGVKGEEPYLYSPDNELLFISFIINEGFRSWFVFRRV